MNHDRSLSFQCLEARKLLTKTHLAAAHSVPAIVAVPLVLDGTLTVNNKAAQSEPNDTGGSTTMVPVSGQFPALGEVRGVWSETVDSYGDYEGPDVVNLSTSKGAFTMTFNNATPGPAHKTATGATYYDHAQQAGFGTRAFKAESEHGTLQLIENRGQTAVQSMVLNTTST